MRYILPSITTHSRSQSTWETKIGEIRELGLREVGLFVTGLSVSEREECFGKLQKLRREYKFEIPFCHAVSSMNDGEFKFLRDEFGTQSFNLHPERDYPLQYELTQEIRNLIYIENFDSRGTLTLQDVEGFAGVCLDVSHLEEARLMNPDGYATVVATMQAHTIGCNHISAIRIGGVVRDKGDFGYSLHVASGPEDVEYLGRYSAEHFSDFCALELENSLFEQMKLLPKVQKYILGIKEKKAA